MNACFFRTVRWIPLWVALLSRATSIMLLVAMPIALLWPYWRQALPEQLTRYLMSAIYEFSSDEMPRCEQFVRHTDISGITGPVVCETKPAQMMV